MDRLYVVSFKTSTLVTDKLVVRACCNQEAIKVALMFLKSLDISKTADDLIVEVTSYEYVIDTNNVDDLIKSFYTVWPLYKFTLLV